VEVHKLHVVHAVAAQARDVCDVTWCCRVMRVTGVTRVRVTSSVRARDTGAAGHRRHGNVAWLARRSGKRCHHSMCAARPPQHCSHRVGLPLPSVHRQLRPHTGV
jgi:hypothetical protein